MKPRPRSAPEKHSVKISTNSPGADSSTPNSCGAEQPPPQWAWHHRMLTQLRNRLLGAKSGSALPADPAQDQATRDRLWADLDAEDDPLFEIDSALQRIRDGVYDLCEETGHAIPADRLRATPWTRYCRAETTTPPIRSPSSS